MGWAIIGCAVIAVVGAATIAPPFLVAICLLVIAGIALEDMRPRAGAS